MPSTLTLLTGAAEETREVAATISGFVQPGDLLVLSGDLGAGKTTFCQGFGRALGVTTPITSPTFTLHHRYRGHLEVHHLDAYRLEELEEVVDLGLAELLDSGGVTLIEWGENILAALPAAYLEIALRLGEGDDDRVLHLRTVGRPWAPRMRSLGEALSRFGVRGLAAGSPEDGSC